MHILFVLVSLKLASWIWWKNEKILLTCF